MLRLIDVCKGFKYGKDKIVVLDKVNIDFKRKELVFILGKSGSGKSTLLNIIGGVLKVDSGSVMLDDKDITKFNSKMLSNYRNNMIGFIYQDYHLIEYMSVIDNIKLGMTIGNNNVNNINSILIKLGIYEKRKMKVNKLSGGEKQRVAIGRAIINNPEIILADEPTGAMDTNNGIRIMNILKELSKDKLVIVVSHDLELANRYADRIINIVDGMANSTLQMDNYKFREIQNKKINNLSIAKLAIKNLLLKKGRTLFTSLAISIGFVSMLLVLCLSKSFNEDINKLENDIVSKFPVSIYNGEYENIDKEIISSKDMIILKDRSSYIHKNVINQKYLDYIKGIDEIKFINYHYDISMPIISDRYNMLDNKYMKMFLDNDFIVENYDILYGRLPNNLNEIILKVDSNNNVLGDILNVFDINMDIDYSELVGRDLRVILNDLYYLKDKNYYYINDDIYELYNDSKVSLKIVGIVREKEMVDDNSYFYYSNELLDYVLKENSNSKILLEQLDKDYNVLGMDVSKEDNLSYLGYNTVPYGIDIYVDNMEDKNTLLSKLENYNKNNEDIIYVDMMNDAIDIVKNIINIITIVLVIFSFISIMVSSLMILILTNNRIVERTREIGILRGLGARNRDICKLFNLENLFIGVLSSIIGIIIIMLLVEPVNMIFNFLLEDDSLFKMYLEFGILGIIFNIIIVVLSGYIPVKIVSKRKIVDCISGS